MTTLNRALDDALSALGPQAKDIVRSTIMKRCNACVEGAEPSIDDVFAALDDLFGPIAEILKERIIASLETGRPDASDVRDDPL